MFDMLGRAIAALQAVARKAKPYAKALVAVAGVLLLLGNAVEDGAFSSEEVKEVLVAVGVALGVYTVPNKPAA